MKKIDFKTRMQWGWFKAAFFGVAIAILIAPTAGTVLDVTDSEKKEVKKENPIVSFINSISFGPKTKVMINGDVVALAKSEEAAKEAYKAARLAYNAEGVQILDVDVTYAEVDKEKDADAIDGLKLLRNEKLIDAILESFDKYAEKDKSLAYTMRIDDYTVTVEKMEDLIAVLEQAQGQYDVEDAFKVGLKLPSSNNVTMYEVDVAVKEQASTEQASAEDSSAEQSTISAESESTEQSEGETAAEGETSEQLEVESTEAEGDSSEQTAAENQNGDEAAVTIPEKHITALTSGESETDESENTESTEEISEGEEAATSAEEGNAEGSEDSQTESKQTAEESQNDNAESAESSEEPVDADVAAQSVNDGIKYVGFTENIQVMETYVSKEQITDKETAFTELTSKNAEASIYIVEPGDSLSVIAENHNMTIDEIKALNPGIESDDNLYYDDRLNITVPKAALQILVQKQVTYKEDYSANVVYEDDAEMFIGETEVVQEGQSGTHTVTDLVTYKDDVEYEREQIQETVQVVAVAQVVRRGTKSKPTYMYPCTNWPITSRYGYRWGRLHAGTDVGVPTGTTVRASRAGKVITAGWVGGYGNCVMIDHGDGVTTVYGHLSEVNVTVGQYVDQGQQIALSGNTGRSTGPHLHFEIRINGSAVDPEPYLAGTNS